HLDGVPAEVDLPRPQPETRRPRERVEDVVPRLAERDRGQRPHVAALVAGPVRLPAVEVADRVDAAGDVVHDVDPDRQPPQDPAPGSATRAGFTARKLRWVNRRW